MRSHLDSICRLPSPRQQFVESVDRVSSDHLGEHVVQIGIGFDAVQLAGLDQRAENCPACAATVAAGEQVVLAPERDHWAGWRARRGLVSASTRPSCRKRVSPFQRPSAYRIASASVLLPGTRNNCAPAMYANCRR